MATTIARDRTNAEENIVFPVESFRSLYPMVLAGLQSTQLRIRQSTYRFVLASQIMGGIRWLGTNSEFATDFLSSLEKACKQFEAVPCDYTGRPVSQVWDWGTMIAETKVEAGVINPLTLSPVVTTDTVKWVWRDANGTEWPLGKEEVYSAEEKKKVDDMVEAFVSFTNFVC